MTEGDGKRNAGMDGGIADLATTSSLTS